MWEVLIAGGMGLAGVALGWWLNRRSTREQREASWNDQLAIRKAQVLADLTQILDGYDLSSGSVRERDDLDEQRMYYTEWKQRLEGLGRELRTLAFLETDDPDARSQVLDSAKQVATVVTVLDIATDEHSRTATMIDQIDNELTRLGGEVKALAAYWKDSRETSE